MLRKIEKRKMALVEKREPEDPTQVPWSCLEEWLQVYKQLYSGNLLERNKAYKTLLVWKARTPKLPFAIECTLDLMQVCLRDGEWTPKINSGEICISYENDLCILYSTVLKKFISHITHIARAKRTSLCSIAKKLNIPHWIIDLEHNLLNNHELPSIDVMRIIATFLATWLREEYWTEKAKNLLKFRDLLDSNDIYIKDLIDLIELWIAVKFYSKINYVLIADLPDTQIKDTLNCLLARFNPNNGLNGKPLTIEDEMELTTVSSLLLSEISKIFDKSDFFMKKKIIVDCILQNEAFLMNSDYLSMITEDKSEINIKNYLPQSLLNFWKDLFILLEEKKILSLLFLQLIELIDKEKNTNKKLLISLWIKCIAQAYNKQKTAGYIYQIMEQKFDSVKEEKSEREILIAVKKEMESCYPELTNVWSLNINKDFLECLTNEKFIRRLILNINEFSKHYIPEILKMLLFKCDPIVKQNLQTIIKTHFQLNKKRKIKIEKDDVAYIIQNLKEIEKSEEKITRINVNKKLADCKIRNMCWNIHSEKYNWNTYPMGLLPWQGDHSQLAKLLSIPLSEVRRVTVKNFVLPITVDAERKKFNNKIEIEHLSKGKRKEERKTISKKSVTTAMDNVRKNIETTKKQNIEFLSNTEEDMNKNRQVSKKESHCNIVNSNTNDIALLNDMKETSSNTKKRKRSVADSDNEITKKIHIDVNITDNQTLKLQNDLVNKSKQCESHSEVNGLIPYRLIQLMYQLDLLMLCSLRKSMYEHKYSSLSIKFGVPGLSEFNNIVLCYENKITYLQIESINTHYVNNSISYGKLFTKEKRNFSINKYFNSYIKYIISESDSSISNIEHFVIFTTLDLDLTETNELQKRRFKNFYPFKFDSINPEESDILKDFLFTGFNSKKRNFYKFSQDKIAKKELLRRLDFSHAVQKILKEKEYNKQFEKKMKKSFLDKLILAVDQPHRQELNKMIKKEMKDLFHINYIELQEKILHDLLDHIGHKKLENDVSEILYNFYLIICFLHENKLFVHFQEKRHDVSNIITVNYKNKISYIQARKADNNIGYSQLFPFKAKTPFSINKYFAFFTEELKKDNHIKYFIIYTNADLDLTEEKELKKRRSTDFYNLKFDSIDIQKKKYKVLKNCSFINKNSIYRFSQEEITREKLLTLLQFPLTLQKKKEKREICTESEKKIKENFLDKLIFAVNQPSNEELKDMIKNQTNGSDFPYNYEKLHEMALRWLEYQEYGFLTNTVRKKLLDDIINNRCSYQKFKNQNIGKEL